MTRMNAHTVARIPTTTLSGLLALGLALAFEFVNGFGGNECSSVPPGTILEFFVDFFSDYLCQPFNGLEFVPSP